MGKALRYIVVIIVVIVVGWLLGGVLLTMGSGEAKASEVCPLTAETAVATMRASGGQEPRLIYSRGMAAVSAAEIGLPLDQADRSDHLFFRGVAVPGQNVPDVEIFVVDNAGCVSVSGTVPLKKWIQIYTAFFNRKAGS